MNRPADPCTRQQIQYLDHAAASDPGRRYKRRLLAALDLRDGQTVVDVGCGPGTDITEMYTAVGAEGLIIGIDHDPDMIAEARDRTSARATVQLLVGDAHALPLAEGSVDRARMDRVGQHLARPAWAVAELRRVIRPGGLVALAEPDWDTLVIDDPDVQTSRAYTRFVVTQVVRNGTIGRQLARLAVDAGFNVQTVDATAVVFSDFAEAEPILRLRSVAERAVLAGALHEEAARMWLDRITRRPFLAGFTCFTVTAQR